MFVAFKLWSIVFADMFGQAKLYMLTSYFLFFPSILFVSFETYGKYVYVCVIPIASYALEVEGQTYFKQVVK